MTFQTRHPAPSRSNTGGVGQISLTGCENIENPSPRFNSHGSIVLSVVDTTQRRQLLPEGEELCKVNDTQKQTWGSVC